MGTGGTITGVGRFLKEKNPRVKIIGADPAGSMLYDFFHTGKTVKTETYKVEGIGEDILPKTLDFSVLDDCLRVTDKESFLWARRLARREGIFAGGSAGSAMAAAMQVAPTLTEKDFMVVFIPDTGSRYLSKIFNNEWMRDNRYFEPAFSVSSGDIAREKAALGLAKEL